MKNIYFIFLLSSLVFSSSSCNRNIHAYRNYTIEKQKVSGNGVVVTAHPLASEAGVEILKKGGNAIDAAIAVQYALTVVYPEAGNIGGGGFMIYKPHDGEAITLDFREKAPLKASRDMYLDEKSNVIPDASTIGIKSVGVPGTVDGIYEMYTKFSKLKDMKLLAAPAISLANKGYAITESEAEGLNETREIFQKVNKHQSAFVKKSLWHQGDILVQRELAKTISHIAKHGREGFYSGDIAGRLVLQMEKQGGLLSLEDLHNYRSVWRKPMTGMWEGNTYYTMALPSSGGILIGQILGMIKDFPLKQYQHNSPEAIHLIAEAEKRAYADRSKYLGDADFVEVKSKTLLSPAYLKERMADYNPNQATSFEKIGPGELKSQYESEETTHFSIIDKWGNAVSITTTLNGGYGSGVVAEGMGFLLNNEMDDFSVKPGTPNSYGLVGSEANAIEPGKRMLSSMSPMIVVKDDQVQSIFGSPGGSTIITTVLQLLLNSTTFGLSPFETVQAYRFHHQWSPDELYIETAGFSEQTQKELKLKGQKLKERRYLGKVEAIFLQKDGTYIGVADRRGDDDVEVVK